jgi:hypothetical protein
MRRFPGQALRIGVSGSALALVQTSRWRGAPLRVLAEQPIAGGLEATAHGVRQLLGAAPPGWPLTIVLADDLLRLWQVTPPPGSARRSDLEAAAALRFHALYGEPAAGWKLAANWDAVRPFLAAAMPRPLLALLEQAAAEHQLDIVEIVPQFVAGLNRYRAALQDGAWCGQVHQQVLTTGVLAAGGVAAVRAAPVPEDAGPAWLGEHIAREALRLNLPVPQRLQLWGQPPAAWSAPSGAGPIRCSQFGPLGDGAWSAAVQLACAGSRA